MRRGGRSRLAAVVGVAALATVFSGARALAGSDAAALGAEGWPELVLELRVPDIAAESLDVSRLLDEGGEGEADRRGRGLRLRTAVRAARADFQGSPHAEAGLTASSLMHSRIDALADLSRARPGLVRPGGILTPMTAGFGLPSFASRLPGGDRLAELASAPGSLLGLRRSGDRSNAVVGRLDASPLPFLDLYGMFGWTWGDVGESRAPRLDAQGLSGAHVGYDDQEYQGVTYGGGGKLSGNWDKFFATVDTKFTLTELDIVDEPLKTFSVAPRVGARSNRGPVKGTFYLGAMYMTVDEDVKAGVDIPGLEGVPLQFDMDISKPWNMLVGTEIEIVENFVFSIEGGFLGRRQVVAGFGAKF